MHAQRETVYMLPIGDPRRQYLLTVRPDEIVDTHRRRVVNLHEMTRLLEPATFILIGELHDNAQHHLFQAQVIDALAQAGRSVIVGIEMFDRTKQHALNLWTLNRLSEAEFVEQSEWRTQWGFDFALYRPIFEVVSRHRLRLVGLNAPRALVRQTARGGWQSIPQAERMGIPDPDLSVEAHRQLFYALLGSGHPTGQHQNDNFYAAQVVWDTCHGGHCAALSGAHSTLATTGVYNPGGERACDVRCGHLVAVADAHAAGDARDCTAAAQRPADAGARRTGRFRLATPRAAELAPRAPLPPQAA
jgi:hypothetical protein